jgi:hypothetical protein
VQTPGSLIDVLAVRLKCRHFRIPQRQLIFGRVSASLVRKRWVSRYSAQRFIWARQAVLS